MTWRNTGEYDRGKYHGYYTTTVEDDQTREVIAVVYASTKELVKERADKIAQAGSFGVITDTKGFGEFLREHGFVGEANKLTDEGDPKNG